MFAVVSCAHFSRTLLSHEEHSQSIGRGANGTVILQKV